MMLRYHPERYRVSRPFSRQVTTLYRRLAGRGDITVDGLNEITKLFTSRYNEELAGLPFEERPADTRFMMKEISYAITYAQYCLGGRNIFHFEPDIVEKFRNSDVDNVPVAAVKLPFGDFYMSFGRQEDLNLWNEGYFVDGAYIQGSAPGEPIHIVLTTIRDDINLRDRYDWIRHQDKYYSFLIDEDQTHSSFGEAIEAALGKQLKEKDMSGLPDMSGKYDIDGRSVQVRDNKKKSSMQEIWEMEFGFPVFREALKLIINGLCYITTYKENIVNRWPEDTPELLLDRLKKATKHSSRQKVTSELTSKGYVKVNYCGRQVSGDNVEVVSAGSREVSSHWRRGHWRNQAYGPNLQEHKLIWIMPVLVRKDKGDPEQGHIYTGRNQE